MAYILKKFVKAEIIKHFMQEEFERIPEKSLMDIIINIDDKETKMLESWERHFQGKTFPGFQLKRIPYAITKGIGQKLGKLCELKRLWIERII